MGSRSYSRALSIPALETRGREPGDGRVAVAVDEQHIDAIFAEVNQSHLPGVAVGIAIDGIPVYRKCFGLASLELPVVLAPSMRMRIGSTSKHFACLAYLLLCEEGLASIDDALEVHLPGVHPVAGKVTLRQLMGNLSGLRDAHDVCWQFSGRGQLVSSAELVDLYRDISDTNTAPGSAWIYCNGGFLLLSSAIERITGQPLEEVLRERIFEPVGMHDTMLRRWDNDFVPNSATLHTNKLGGGYERWYLGTAMAGEGGMVSTVEDMLRWLAHMDRPVVGSAATWALLKEPQKLNNGFVTSYGLGLFTTEYRGVQIVHHPGGVMGGNAQMLKVPAAGLDIAIMANRHDVSAVMFAEKIVDACVAGLKRPQRFAVRPIEGLFRSRSTGRVVQMFVKAGQQIASVDGVDMPVEPDRVGALRPAGASRFLLQSITPGDGGEHPATIRFEHFGNIDELSAVSTAASDGAAIVGRYRCEAASIEVSITQSDGALRMQTVGKFGSVIYRLECLGENIWRARSRHPTPRDGVYTFDLDGAGFRFSNDRIWSLPFDRHA